MDNIKRDTEVMRILDLKEVSRVICNTDKSFLTLKLRKGEKEYWLYLDSVPVSKEDNKELMELLFPKKEVEIPQVNKKPTESLIAKQMISDQPFYNSKKQIGRPKTIKTK
jgi:hypothetical protein